VRGIKKSETCSILELAQGGLTNLPSSSTILIDDSAILTFFLVEKQSSSLMGR